MAQAVTWLSPPCRFRGDSGQEHPVLSERSEPVDVGTAPFARLAAARCRREPVACRHPLPDTLGSTWPRWQLLRGHLVPSHSHPFPTQERVPGCTRCLGADLEPAGRRRHPPSPGLCPAPAFQYLSWRSWAAAPGLVRGKDPWEKRLPARLLHGWRTGRAVLPSAPLPRDTSRVPSPAGESRQREPRCHLVAASSARLQEAGTVAPGEMLDIEHGGREQVWGAELPFELPRH